MRLSISVVALVGVLASGPSLSGQQPGGEPLRWYRGNTHTHTLNSDGDTTPDEAARWYREQKYHFVVITDHNLVTPVDGLNAIYAAPERFLVIHGEEVTDSSADKKPVHLNLIDGEGFVAPQGGATPADALRRNITAMLAAKGVISINHPNFGWALTAEDLLSGKGAHLLEIANAHPQVNNNGGGISPSAEALWDAMLTAGIPVWGAASDDMHQLKQPWSKAAARPGQGWIVVRAPRLASDAILAAIRRGDFYASTGVELTDIQASPQRVTLAIKEQPSSRYTVSFVGRNGRTLKTLTAAPYRYDIAGDEGYVRAKVVDSNGFMAWTQPVFTASR
jgi:hypothetical protein